MRNVEGNTCQGTCVLKELLEPTPQKDKAPFTTLQLKWDEFFTNEDFAFSFAYPNMLKALISTPYLLYDTQSLIFKIWHPPKILL